MKTKIQQVADALYYLNKDGTSPEDEAKAIKILTSVVRSSLPEITSRQLADITKVPEKRTIQFGEFSWMLGKEIAIVIGHERPKKAKNGQKGWGHGGAKGERVYQLKVAKIMKRILEEMGAKVLIYQHRLRAYGARQDAMRAAVKNKLPNCSVCIELHYDGYKPRPAASGYHFQYLGAKKLASAIRDRFKAKFPHKRPRGDGRSGIMKNTRKNGAGFLRKSPAWAVLVEPFFITNPAEKSFFSDKHEELAEIYCLGISDFIKTLNN